MNLQAQHQASVESALKETPVAVQFVQPPTGADPRLNTTGHIDLVWSVVPDSAQEPAAYELQGSRTPDFPNPLTYYSGVDVRSFLSGLAEGSYFFRVRSLSEAAGPGMWSEVLAVEVDYVDQWKVFVLMAVGLVCLIATVFIILRGSLRRGDYAEDVV